MTQRAPDPCELPTVCTLIDAGVGFKDHNLFATSRLTRLKPDVPRSKPGFVKIAHDITDRKYQEESMRHKAFYDRLTGLPNRALFFERLANANEQGNDESGFGVIFLDLDDFKLLNDKYGPRPLICF